MNCLQWADIHRRWVLLYRKKKKKETQYGGCNDILVTLGQTGKRRETNYNREEKLAVLVDTALAANVRNEK